MVAIRLAARLEDSGSGTEPLVSAGWGYRVRNSVDYVDSNGDLVVAAWPAGGGWKAFNASVVTLDLDPRPPDEPYLLQIRGPIDPSAAVKMPTVREEYRTVLNTTAPNTSWYALDRVTGPGPDGTEYPIGGYDQLDARIDAIDDRLDTIVIGGGGATTLAAVSGISDDGRALIGGTKTFAQMRADLQVAPLASPALTGNPTAPTQTAGDSSTKLATTAFVQGEKPTWSTISGKPAVIGAGADQAAARTAIAAAPVDSPTFTGTPAAPTPTTGDNTTKVATTAFVTAALAAASAATIAVDPSDTDVLIVTVA